MKPVYSILGVAFSCSQLVGADLLEDKCDLKNKGVFTFPQDKAVVLCDTKELRVSVWSDRAHLYVQSVLWTDGDDSISEAASGQEVGDQSSLIVDADGDGKVTRNVDRLYTLNPWVHLPGLRYQVKYDDTVSSGIEDDSQGRGSVQYIETPSGKVRVDSYVIPLAEIGRKTGEKVRFGYYGTSPKPDLILNSIGYKQEGDYHSSNLPWAKFHEVTLVDRPATLDLKKIPDGRDKQVVDEKQAVKPKP
jgi:hypothetical protein